MFLISLKSLKVRIILLLLLIVLVVFSAISIKKVISKDTATSKVCGRYSLLAQDNEERIKFLSQFNLEVDPEPLEETQIRIPTEFNRVYENYNNIQKENGLNLEKHKGKTCTRYTYKVLNYEGEKSGVRVNLLIYDGKVIAGDICSVELGGFMSGFTKNRAPENDNSKITYNINKTSAVSANL